MKSSENLTDKLFCVPVCNRIGTEFNNLSPEDKNQIRKKAEILVIDRLLELMDLERDK